MKKILVIKHDKIGDFVLTWPALYLLRKAMPDATIDVFVAPVVKSFAQACPYVDNTLIDSQDDASIAEHIAQQHYDAVIVLLSEFRIYKILNKSNIPYKLVPKHNWYQYLYQHRASNEYLNSEGCWRGACMLVEHFLTHHGYAIPALPNRFWDMSARKQYWQEYYQKLANEKLIFIHPGTGGSSGCVPIEKLVKLIINIDRMTPSACHFVLTFNGSERELAEEIQALLANTSINISLAKPLDRLIDFSESLVAADMFIAGSTGPLHIAGLHNVPTVGFYAGRRSTPHIRWGTLSEPSKRFAYTPPVGKRTGRNMALINFDQVSNDIADFLNKQS
ncbi:MULTISPECIES: glycosyltransferase family 9 protein [Shewanella]|uniref:Lipopolysaccharide heptosyltransferase family protein n=1 Tax=Shewanella psychromarinicola TaxID=2487742 RepID=A0A3N4E2D3_9GAMM|nr:glycosyltransferase family 9 protein [Shewanella psychromarinicola]AZG34223.1 lipopolysaccharide heptosyltransferase family protein [Shewanella psychromarinicola]MCL1081883.1 glycosyltransferase family 9 protein [Shewanella psychromarinicola]RPA32319.1 lipopolysaccharide heptosyltransferase family protein [Shewanella psychromarinicola]